MKRTLAVFALLLLACPALADGPYFLRGKNVTMAQVPVYSSGSVRIATLYPTGLADTVHCQHDVYPDGWIQKTNGPNSFFTDNDSLTYQSLKVTSGTYGKFAISYVTYKFTDCPQFSKIDSVRMCFYGKKVLSTSPAPSWNKPIYFGCGVTLPATNAISIAPTSNFGWIYITIPATAFKTITSGPPLWPDGVWTADRLNSKWYGWDQDCYLNAVDGSWAEYRIAEMHLEVWGPPQNAVGAEIAYSPSAVVAPKLKQTLYPASDRGYHGSDIATGETHGEHTQDCAKTHDADDATYDRIGIIGASGDPAAGTIGVTWTMDECTYTGNINTVFVEIKAKYATTGIGTPAPDIAPTLGDLDVAASQATTTAAAVYTFTMPTYNGGAWNKDIINSAVWGWRSQCNSDAEATYTDAYEYEYKVLVWGHDSP